MRLLLATRNENKVREIRHILGHQRRVVSLSDLGLDPHPDEERIENADTFRENAHEKAIYFARQTGLTTIADDSGLVVHALQGEPGVRSKRFAGRDDLSGAELDEANNQHLLQRLEDVPNELRTAHFVCVAAVASPKRALLTAIGTRSGRITRQPKGNQGFGYDPLFLIPEIGVTLGSLAPNEKNRRSHRARAFNTLAAHLEYARPGN